jgi:hypothetical protein
MRNPRLISFARYVGLGAAILVPALVVAQSLPLAENLRAGQVMRAEDILQMRDALQNALGRVAQLEATAQAPLSKDRVEVREAAIAVAPGAIATASARCDDAADIAIDCNCGGDNGEGTNGSTQLDQRIIQTQNPAGGVSQCDCVAQNVGTNANARVFARVTCLVP